MPLTNAGCNLVARAVARAFGGPSIGDVYFGIGDSDEAFDATQVDLLGTNVRRAIMAAPEVDGPSILLRAEFEPGAISFSEAAEYGMFDSSGTMLNRLLVSNLGEMYAAHTQREQMRLTFGFGDGVFSLTTAGRAIFMNAAAKGLSDAQLTPLYFGVGNGDADFDPEQTDLQGAVKIRRPLVAGYPKPTGSTILFAGDFETTDLISLSIAEFGLFDAISGGNMIFRSVTGDLGEFYPEHEYQPHIGLTIRRHET